MRSRVATWSAHEAPYPPPARPHAWARRRRHPGLPRRPCRARAFRLMCATAESWRIRRTREAQTPGRPSSSWSEFEHGLLHSLRFRITYQPLQELYYARLLPRPRIFERGLRSAIEIAIPDRQARSVLHEYPKRFD